MKALRNVAIRFLAWTGWLPIGQIAGLFHISRQRVWQIRKRGRA